MTNSPFIYLDHIADTRFIAYGDSLEHVFENSALAMFNVIADVSNISPEVEFDVEVYASELEDLLVHFLSELLFLFDAEETLFGNITVHEIQQTNGIYSVTATISGEPIDSSKQNFRTEVKAVTYNHIRVEKTDSGFETEVVLDL
ncbi:Protein archease [Methanosarcinaceae archaeon Ag5]|uniref:Protein archease n=1 Tax=Methanolapillus africanus TaxID=3028297 RepID=A0AAE4SD71_9EURY|nr:Protein archease [Methanosarcinaceae archaeon Ag5]